jgi:hypothetical protein
VLCDAKNYLMALMEFAIIILDFSVKKASLGCLLIHFLWDNTLNGSLRISGQELN